MYNYIFALLCLSVTDSR